jgi:hypothetical protein
VWAEKVGGESERVAVAALSRAEPAEAIT